jgi:hypothetical protein
MALRGIARIFLVAVALASAWIGYLAVGSWETTDAWTTAGTVLIVGALISVTLVIVSLKRVDAAPALWSAAAVSIACWTIAMLVD